jgi:hypothetical protein
MHDFVAAYLLLFFGALVVSWLIQLLVGWCAYNAILPIPAEQREIEPALAFGLMVPFVGTLLNFLVLPALSRSYQRWFAARGVTGEGDCGENLAWWHAIVSVGAWVPCLPLAGLSAIVLQVLYLLRLRRLCRRASAPGA